MAFLAVSIDASSVWSQRDWKVEGRRGRNAGTLDIRAKEAHVRLKMVGDKILVGHLYGLFEHGRVDVLKDEMGKILDGYPPYYRKELHTLGGATISNFIPSPADVEGGGWVIAAGLGEVQPVMYYVNKQKEYFADSEGPERLRASLKRVLDVLRSDIAPHYPGDASLAAAIQGIEDTVTSGTEGNLPHGYNTSKAYTRRLTSNECDSIVNLFNRSGPLDVNEKAIVDRHLLEITMAAMSGVATVTEYVRNRLCWLPSWVLEEYQNVPVYLQDCAGDIG